MRSYPDTLVSRTLAGVVAIQRAFGKEHGIPWGISESGWAGMDDHGHYHYQAFGIPQIALKWDAVAGPVISPYSTCLCLGLEPIEALKNLKRMAKMGWAGAFGFYEAADYQESTKTPKLVKEWMAHHQGMSLLALLNLLYDNIVQDWFHANAHLEATQLLLHEKPMHTAQLRAEFAASQPKKKAS
jgi:cyclic beta-1,2-glucan synthetase